MEEVRVHIQSPIQLKDLSPITEKGVEQLKKIWGADKLIVMASKGDTWHCITRNTDALDEIDMARSLLERATEGIMRPI